MFNRKEDNFSQHIHFLILPNFSLFGLTSMLAPLRHANRLSNEPLYTWTLVSEASEMVPTSDNIEIRSHASIKDIDRCECLIICCGASPNLYTQRHILGFIRKQAAFGAYIGAQDTGAHLIAAAGALDGYKSTLHWELLETTPPLFPNVNFVQELYVIDRKRFACSGALSGLDMMLHIIKIQHGHQLSSNVSNALIYSQLREHHSPQKLSPIKHLDCRNKHLLGAVALMERNIEEPLSIAELANYVQISERELERLFKHYLDTSPLIYYRRIRLNLARSLLQQTNDSVTKIAESCGFQSLSHFSRCYQKEFLKKPSDER